MPERRSLSGARRRRSGEQWWSSKPRDRACEVATGVSIAVAASAGFASPLGYQTHLMVYGVGGYRFSDFARIGVPLDILIGVVTVLMAPLVWPF